ncbi:DUF4806 domain-containing protein [Aphis craccivora]|uniref:DUF4806 domain-containing protein n=1 Tax=Aphis craccivora TaxID=307492 RepID=A0A6G0YSL9_APHCR|nr:DUF4806 domain-containing protein [Aphis craccivora]
MNYAQITLVDLEKPFSMYRNILTPKRLHFKAILSNKQWKHFLKFNPNCSHLISIAHELLDTFVKQFEILYGRPFMSHNVHDLLHIKNTLCSGLHSKGPLLDNINMKSHQFKALQLSTFIIKPHIDADSDD